MNESQDPLSQLRDIHLPEPVSFWPPAPGWWLLLILVAAILAVAWFVRRRMQRPNIRQAALEELHLCISGLDKEQQLHDQYMQVSILIRRFAISLFGRDRVAGLTGERWLAFLDETGGTDFFSNGPGRDLVTVPYGGLPMQQAGEASTDGTVPDMALLEQQIRQWVVKNT